VCAPGRRCRPGTTVTGIWEPDVGSCGGPMRE
jgi:hypothetical protein